MKKKLIYVSTGIVALSAVIFFLCPANSADIKEDLKVGVLADSINCDTTTATQEIVSTEMNGVRITEIDSKEYNRLLKNGYNVPLSKDSTHVNRYSDSLIIHTEKEKITLLNLPYNEEVASDFSIEWQYDGYRAESQMSFFSFGGFEWWGYYATNKSGLTTRFVANDAPVFCKGSDLFATWFEDPYEGVNSVNIYKILPDGRLAEITIINMKENEPVNKLSWVGERSIVAVKPGPEAVSKYIRIDLTDEVLKASTVLPLVNPQEFNETVLTIKSKQVHSN